MKIAVIGSGSWGCALASVLAEKGNHVALWSYFEEESRELEQYRENRQNLPGLILPETVSGYRHHGRGNGAAHKGRCGGGLCV